MSARTRIHRNVLSPADWPIDTLRDASAALTALTALIGECEDLHVLGPRDTRGLTVILDALAQSIVEATDALSEREAGGSRTAEDAAYLRGYSDGVKAASKPKEAGDDPGP